MVFAAPRHPAEATPGSTHGACFRTVPDEALIGRNLIFLPYSLKSLFRFPMGFSFVKAATSFFPGVVVAGLLTSASLVAVQNPAQAAVTPAYTTTNSTGGSYGTSAGSSFGFFFDTVGSKKIDALGFASQAGWNTGTSVYTVSLWSFTNQGNLPGDYTLIDSRTFTPGNPYFFQSGYFYQDIDPVNLADSTAGDSPTPSSPNGQRGFVIGVDGDFSSAPGNVLFEGGTASFVPGIINNSSGYGDFGDGFFPVPAFGVPNNAGPNGYFNGNFSIAPVPTPLPLLGAAACFSFSRRIRNRIRSASN